MLSSPLPRCHKNSPSYILSPEEVLEFLGCVRLNNHRTILTCCYAAGLRISEALALQAAHIDSQRMVIRVELGKGQKDRYVMLSPKLLEILRQWWRQERPQHWLFPGKISGTHITAAPVEEACHEALQQCRISKPVTPHDAPCICGASARARHGCSHDPTAARASQFSDHRSLPAYRHHQGLLYHQSS